MMAAATASRQDGNAMVLVAEEDDVARAFLADNLTADGYVVWTADSKEKVLAILSVRQPDVIVVDVNGKTLGLIDAVRDGDGLVGRVDPDTPLIVLTARADELHRIRVLDRGGDDVLAKPYSYPELRALISSTAAFGMFSDFKYRDRWLVTRFTVARRLPATENCPSPLGSGYVRAMGRATGGCKATSAARGMRRRQANARAVGRPAALIAPPWKGADAFHSAWEGALTIQGAGAAAAMLSGMKGREPAEAEKSAAWEVAAYVSCSALPVMRQAEVVKVSALAASALPQAFTSNRDAIRFATGVQLPSAATFYDFRHPKNGVWILSNPEPIQFDGALVWDDDAGLSVIPLWLPLNSDGSIKRDPDDALARGPVMRVVFGAEDAVLNALEPGTLGGAAEDGELYCWPEMPQGGEHARAADRALRCSLRLLDLLAVLQNAPPPERPPASAGQKRAALQTGQRIPRVYDL